MCSGAGMRRYVSVTAQADDSFWFKFGSGCPVLTDSRKPDQSRRAAR